MIERTMTICIGLLVASLPFAVWIAVDWWKIRPLFSRERWARVGKYWRVVYLQWERVTFDARTRVLFRRFLRRGGQLLYVDLMVLVWAWSYGWGRL